MRHVRALLACAVALSAAACAQTPTTPEPARFEGGTSWGSGNHSAPSSPSYNAGIMFGGGHRDGTSTTTSTTSTTDSTAVTGGGSGNGRGIMFGGGQ